MIINWFSESSFSPSDEIWPIRSYHKIVPQIYHLLFRAIIRGELLPGVWLSESRIAKRCGVSRQPVREAILKLVDMGLVRTFPQRGSIVAIIRPSAVLNARFAREAIEADVVSTIARTATADQISELKSEISLQHSAEGAERLLQLDHRFHYILLALCRMTGMWELVRELKARTDQVLFLRPDLIDAKRIADQHACIVECIAKHDIVGASTAMRERLREVLDVLPDIMISHPDCFDGNEITAG